MNKDKFSMNKILSIRKALIASVAAMAVTASAARADFQLDLTAAGSSGSLSANDMFLTSDNQSTGTGVIQSFVRISAANQDVVEGYNTDARKTQFDENSSPQFTRHLSLSAIPIVTIGGVAYREFLLDINQLDSDPLLSLNELQIFIGNKGDPINATVGAGGTLNFGSQASLIYDMDAGTNGDARIDLNYTNNKGSGSGDMFAYIADSLFTGGSFVTLYSKFGVPNNNNDGFEEWAVRTPQVLDVVPEPSSIVLAATGLVGLGLVRRFRRRVQVKVV